MQLGFVRRLRHPFFPNVKLTPAADAHQELPALCGGFAELCRAAGRGVRVQRAVFPLLPPGDPFLTTAERDALWRLFQVPIYALLLDGHGRVAGYECEAQHGVHIVEGYRPVSRAAMIESATCECGRPGCRLLPEEPVEGCAESALLAVG